MTSGDDALPPPSPEPPDPLGLLKARKPREVTVAVCVDDAAAEACDRAQQVASRAESLAEARPGPTNEQAAREARQTADTAQAAVDALTVKITFRSIGKTAWGRLQDEHPPTPAQVAAAAAQGVFGGVATNADTFPPAAIVACALVHTPDGLVTLDLPTVQGWFDDPGWNDGDLDALYEAARYVNRDRRVDEWGKGSGTTPS